MIHPQVVLFLVAVSGAILAAAVVGMCAWSLVRWWLLPPVGAAALATIARTLAAALRQGRSADLVLYGLQARLRWPLPRRLRGAGRAVGDGVPVVEALIRAELLPRALHGPGLAAERMGPPALAAWLDGLAAPADERRPWWAACIPAGILILTTGFLVSFLGIVIAPKYEQIFRELGLTLPPLIPWLARHATSAVLLAPPALALAVGAAWALSAWNWRQRAHLDTGRLLATAPGLRIDEARLAGLLSAGQPARAAQLETAGAAGDFAGIAAAAGWRCRDGADLLERYLRAERRHRIRARVAASLLPVALPVALGIPVFLICQAFFGALITIVQRLAEAG